MSTPTHATAARTTQPGSQSGGAVSSRAAAEWRLGVLAAGPLVTLGVVALLSRGAPYVDFWLEYVVLAVTVAWSPLPWSWSSLLLDHERGQTLRHVSRARRAALLVPWMLTRSPARLEMRVSVAGWLASVAVVVAAGLGR